jgi:hypothetical protein
MVLLLKAVDDVGLGRRCRRQLFVTIIVKDLDVGCWVIT